MSRDDVIIILIDASVLGVAGLLLSLTYEKSSWGPGAIGLALMLNVIVRSYFARLRLQSNRVVAVTMGLAALGCGFLIGIGGWFSRIQIPKIEMLAAGFAIACGVCQLVFIRMRTPNARGFDAISNKDPQSHCQQQQSVKARKV